MAKSQEESKERFVTIVVEPTLFGVTPTIFKEVSRSVIDYGDVVVLVILGVAVFIGICLYFYNPTVSKLINRFLCINEKTDWCAPLVVLFVWERLHEVSLRHLYSSHSSLLLCPSKNDCDHKRDNSSINELLFNSYRHFYISTFLVTFQEFIIKEAIIEIP